MTSWSLTLRSRKLEPFSGDSIDGDEGDEGDEMAFMDGHHGYNRPMHLDFQANE